MGTTNLHRPGDRGPSVTAIGLWGSSGGKRLHLLTDEKRARLAVISSVLRFDKGVEIYREGDSADAIFNIIGGVVKTYKNLDHQTKHIVAFLFPEDLVGLPEEGKYDIADYVGMSAEAVSRSFHALASRGAIVFRDRRHLKIVNRSCLERAAANLEPHQLPYRQQAAS